MDLNEIKSHLKELQDAIQGNDMGNPGLLPTVSALVDKVNQAIATQDKRISKLEWRQKIMWTVLSTLTSAGSAATGVGIWQAVVNSGMP